MSKKKNVVKKGECKHDPAEIIITQIKAYNVQAEEQGVPKLTLMDEVFLQNFKHEQEHFWRVFMSDLFTLALGRMGWRQKRFEKLDELMLEVAREYDKEFVEDRKDDPELLHSRYCFEQEIKSYTGKMYRNAEERYG